MTRPHPRGIMCRSARRVAQKVWFRLRSSSYCHSSSGMSTMRVERPVPPALQTMMSRCPKWSMAKSTRPSTSAWSVAPPWKKAMRSPPPISSRACWPLSAERPLMTTRAPSAGRPRRRRVRCCGAGADGGDAAVEACGVHVRSCRVAAGPHSWPWSRECFDGAAGHRFGQRRTRGWPGSLTRGRLVATMRPKIIDSPYPREECSAVSSGGCVGLRRRSGRAGAASLARRVSTSSDWDRK